MKLWTGWVVIVLVASLALAGCGKKEGSGSVGVDQSSAKATMETIARAFKAHDGQAMAACLPPEYKDTMGPTFVAMMDMMTKVDSMKKAAQAKFGKEAADKALKGLPAEKASKYGPAGEGINEDGTVDWNKVKVTENGDTATIETNGKPSKETLKKIDGKWCMALEGMTPEKAKKEAEQGKKMMTVLGNAYADVEKQVKDGTIAKAEDLQKALNDTMMKVMTEAMKDATAN